MQNEARYPSLGQIHATEDLAEMDVIPGLPLKDGSISPYWRFPDGSPMKIRVRAPSFQDQREIEQEAGEDDTKHLIATIWRCVVSPKISADEARVALAGKNAAALIQLYDNIWSLADYPAALVAAEAERVLGLHEEEGDPAAA